MVIIAPLLVFAVLAVYAFVHRRRTLAIVLSVVTAVLALFLVSALSVRTERVVPPSAPSSARP